MIVKKMEKAIQNECREAQFSFVFLGFLASKCFYYLLSFNETFLILIRLRFLRVVFSGRKEGEGGGYFDPSFLFQEELI